MTQKSIRFERTAEAEQLVKELSKQKGLVTDIQEKVKTENAPLPYDLTEIQREANRDSNFLQRKRCLLYKVYTKPIKLFPILELTANI